MVTSTTAIGRGFFDGHVGWSRYILVGAEDTFISAGVCHDAEHFVLIQNTQPCILQMEQRDIQDSLDSLHKRTDRFYQWASQLQVEFRDIKQRIGFLESMVQENIVFKQKGETEEDDSALLSRIKAAKQTDVSISE
jgi:hypothetical protein